MQVAAAQPKSVSSVILESMHVQVMHEENHLLRSQHVLALSQLGSPARIIWWSDVPAECQPFKRAFQILVCDGNSIEFAVRIKMPSSILFQQRWRKRSDIVSRCCSDPLGMSVEIGDSSITRASIGGALRFLQYRACTLAA